MAAIVERPKLIAIATQPTIGIVASMAIATNFLPIILNNCVSRFLTNSINLVHVPADDGLVDGGTAVLNFGVFAPA
jgi:hypothetical protein